LAGAWVPPPEPIPGERFSLREALDRARFELLAPSVTPQGLELAGVWYSSDDGRATAYLVYAPCGLEAAEGVSVPEVILSGGMVIVEIHRSDLPPEASKSLMEGFRKRTHSPPRDPLELLAERNPAAPLDRVVNVTVIREPGATTYRYRFRDGTWVVLTVPDAQDLFLEVGGRPVYAHLVRGESPSHPNFWHEVTFFSEDWETQYLVLASPKIPVEEVLDAVRSMLEESPCEEPADNESAARVVCIPWVPGYDLDLPNLSLVERTVWNSTLIYPEEDVVWMWYESWLFKGMVGEELAQKQAHLEQLVRRAMTGSYSPEFSRALEEARESNFTVQGWLSDFPDVGDAELVDVINATAVEVENLTHLILLLSERHGVLRALFLISKDRAYQPDFEELAAEEDQLEVLSEEFTQKWIYVRELIYRAKYGDYSPEFRSQLDQARASNLTECAYLRGLVEWEDGGLGVYEMLNATLAEIRELTWRLVYLTEKCHEELVLATLASSNGTFVVRGCPPSENPPINGQHYYSGEAGTVWVGCYGFGHTKHYKLLGGALPKHVHHEYELPTGT